MFPTQRHENWVIFNIYHPNKLHKIHLQFKLPVWKAQVRISCVQNTHHVVAKGTFLLVYDTLVTFVLNKMEQMFARAFDL